MFNHDELLHCTASSCTTLSNLTGHLDYTPAFPWQRCSWSYRCVPPPGEAGNTMVGLTYNTNKDVSSNMTQVVRL